MSERNEAGLASSPWDVTLRISAALSGRGLRRPAGDPLVEWMLAECDAAEAAAKEARLRRAKERAEAHARADYADRAYRRAAARLGRAGSPDARRARDEALEARSRARLAATQASATDYALDRGVDTAVEMTRYYLTAAREMYALSYIGPLPICDSDREAPATDPTAGELAALRGIRSYRLSAERCDWNIVVVDGDVVPRRDIDDRVEVGSAWLAASRRLGAIACALHDDCAECMSLAVACAAGRAA